MTDRLISGGWWLATMMMIIATGAGAMWTAYRGVFSTFAGAYIDGTIYTLACFPLGAACYLLCRYRGDMVCE